jgi:hypothetical protein
LARRVSVFIHLGNKFLSFGSGWRS